MRTKSTRQPVAAVAASNATTNPPPSPAAPPPAAPSPSPSPFTDFAGLCAYLPQYKARTLRAMVKARILPHVRPPGTRKLGFHLPAVAASMLRFSKGGIEA